MSVNKVCSGVRIPQWWKLWGKTKLEETNQSGLYHPLLCHMLDVAAVAACMWDNCIFSRIKDRFVASIGSDARFKIILLTGSHDIGKASPAFQNRVPNLAAQLELPFSVHDVDRPHGFITAKVLGDILQTNVPAKIAGGHHGAFPRAMDLQLGQGAMGNQSWCDVRKELFEKFIEVIGFNNMAAEVGIVDSSIVPILAGFISVADWIGSNQEFFPCVAEKGVFPDFKIGDYWEKTQNQAKRALENLGWLPAVKFSSEKDFYSVFEGYKPNDIQNIVIELVAKRGAPYLMIIEAPMGVGKTEAALYAADMAMCRGFACGMYVAMPTQATSNAMFRRVLDDYLRRRGHKGKLNLQLVHGDALLAKAALIQEGETTDYKVNGISDEGNADVEVQSWFTARKRPLLAPFGIGTIDQALLSVLKTRHWFVRVFGLAGKVVVFDEVHAYDAYMSTILERLLRWLAEVDCTVILLSATLPEARRKALMEAYSGAHNGTEVGYPRITLSSPIHHIQEKEENIPFSVMIPSESPRVVKMHIERTDSESLTNLLKERLKNGGCGAVICNTVNRSIEVFRHLRDSLKETECLLFHARTLQKWRREREAETLHKFGKGKKQEDGTYSNPNRPKRAVLVATQVIEQSLDLDFDLMVSEIAPVDLLLQRCGRLHRHPRWRPAGLGSPLFIVLCDAGTEGQPPESFGNKTESVYDRYILLRTWLALRHRNKITLPNEIETLVEDVYGESNASEGNGWDEALNRAKEQMESVRRESERAAGRLLVCQPKDPSEMIEDFNDQLADDEDPEVHKTVRAATREGDPSIAVVMLPEGDALSSNPSIEEVRELLEQSAKLSHRGLFPLLLQMKPPTEWARNTHLHHARLLRLDKHKQAKIGDYILTLDEMLGVVIEKAESKNNE